MSDEPLVTVDNLSVRFGGRNAAVNAVNDVSFTLREGDVLGILGESGSGKSVTLRALMRLLPPRKAAISGRIRIGGRDVLALDRAGLAALRGPTVAMIFQEPMTALDPVFTIGQQIVEPIMQHERIGTAAARLRGLELLDRVQIPSARRRFDAYPHQLSGGLRQRAMIAIALACRPRLLLADEPTTALDATVQIQILLLLRTLQRELGMAMIFVTHDLGVAIEIAPRLAIMYAGRFVETGPVRDVIVTPHHPYTEGLLRSTVHEVAKGERLHPIQGSPPNLAALPPGCSFAPRCGYAESRCRAEPPIERAIRASVTHAHTTRCFFPERVARSRAAAG